MPTYLYACSEKHETEVEHRITQDPLTVCPRPECNATCKRLIQPTSFILKGYCWALDGYGTTDTKQRARHDAVSKPFLYHDND